MATRVVADMKFDLDELTMSDRDYAKLRLAFCKKFDAAACVRVQVIFTVAFVRAALWSGPWWGRQ
eukprot:3814043-Pleurochrysis_carterae.AAC.1